MATKAEQIKSNALEKLEEITRNPLPTYNVDGQQVSWNQYQRLLMDMVTWADKQIDRDEGPYELTTKAYT